MVSFKIEGRLKSPHYVAAATQTYRAVIDGMDVSTQGRRDLEQCFSRGLTHGFLDGVNHQELVQGRFPKNRGVRIGTVVEVTSHGVVVALADELRGDADASLPIKPGDGVVFDEGHPEQDEQGDEIARNLTMLVEPRLNAVQHRTERRGGQAEAVVLLVLDHRGQGRQQPRVRKRIGMAAALETLDPGEIRLMSIEISEQLFEPLFHARCTRLSLFLGDRRHALEGCPESLLPVAFQADGAQVLMR